MSAAETAEQKIASTADLEQIMRILPHRYPFLLIDKVIDMEAFEAATGVKNVTFNEPQFQGHFPGTPILPGVMIVEAMAQTAAVLVGTSMGIEEEDLLVYFMSIDSCKFRRKVVPGDVLHLKVTKIRGKPSGRAWKFKGVATVDGDLAAEAVFMAMMDRPKADA